jgi:hypothetical protein
VNLTPEEARFLTALVREQNQSGCRGPAHDLLRRHAYPQAPLAGPGSLIFAYDAVPLTSIVLQGFTDLQAIDDFLRKAEAPAEFVWPWASADDYRGRLEEARREWTIRKGVAIRLGAEAADVTKAAMQSRQTGTSG